MTTAKYFKHVLSKLVKYGFLLESDTKLPSVCGLITGGPLTGSWWSHPLAQDIFQVNEQLEDHPDVLITKLISGKVTFVHRELWPEIVAIGTAKQSWQTARLSAPAQELLNTVKKAGFLRTDQMVGRSSSTAKKDKPGDIARELERRLLIHAEQVHTESGAHAKALETWEHWSKRKSFTRTVIQAEEAKKNLEERLRKLNDEFDGTARLPWSAR
jgi:hypothetical protein